MKRHFEVMISLFVLIPIFSLYGQNENKTALPEHRIAMENFPKDRMINYVGDWGGMVVAVNEMPAGSDLAPLLVGLKNNSCQVPHWGYILKGVLQLNYDDGKEEVLRAGDLFYMRPGHKAKVLEDLKIMDFSPEKGWEKLVTHLENKMAEMSK